MHSPKDSKDVNSGYHKRLRWRWVAKISTVHGEPDSAYAEREHLTESEWMPQEEEGVLLQEKRASRHETMSKHIWIVAEIDHCISMFFFLDATACYTLTIFNLLCFLVLLGIFSWHLQVPAAHSSALLRLRNCCNCRKKTTEDLAEAQEEDQARVSISNISNGLQDYEIRKWNKTSLSLQCRRHHSWWLVYAA